MEKVETTKGHDIEEIDTMPKQSLRYQIDFDAIFKLTEEERDFYLSVIKREANSYDMREMISEYLSKYDNNVFGIENKEIKEYFIQNSEILSPHTMVSIMRTNNLIIDHREANINEALN